MIRAQLSSPKAIGCFDGKLQYHDRNLDGLHYVLFTQLQPDSSSQALPRVPVLQVCTIVCQRPLEHLRQILLLPKCFF